MIHRKTFYLHYACIEALYEDILSELSEDYYRAIDKIPADAPSTEVNRVLRQFQRILLKPCHHWQTLLISRRIGSFSQFVQFTFRGTLFVRAGRAVRRWRANRVKIRSSVRPVKNPESRCRKFLFRPARDGSGPGRRRFS